MINKHSRDSSRTRSRKRRECIVRRTCYAVVALMMITAGSLVWRHQKSIEISRLSNASANGKDTWQSPVPATSKPANTVKKRSMVTSIIFGEREVLPLNSRGEYVAGGEAVFVPDSVPPVGRGSYGLKKRYPASIQGAKFVDSKTKEADKAPLTR